VAGCTSGSPQSGHPTLSAAQGLSSANLGAVYRVFVFITYFMKILHLVQRSSEVNQSRHTAMGEECKFIWQCGRCTVPVPDNTANTAVSSVCCETRRGFWLVHSGTQYSSLTHISWLSSGPPRKCRDSTSSWAKAQLTQSTDLQHCTASYTMYVCTYAVRSSQCPQGVVRS